MQTLLYKNIIQILIIAGILLSFISCRKDKFDTNPSTKLGFSVDTILFDTVFTTIGSTTNRLMVYNNSDEKIKISTAYLAGGTSSNFSININGIPCTSLSDIEIESKDSLFIFVKVTVDPNHQNLPFIISDSIIFETNGNIQQIQLVAWGQNAHFYSPKYFPRNFPAYSVITTTGDVTWTDDLPYVIYGYAVVDSAFKLTIKEGVEVYMHSNAALMVYKDGTLKIEGTKDKPVVFQGDRLEYFYQDDPASSGQWGKIWLSAGSIDNEINYAIIKNGQIGIHVDTIGNSTNPTLTLTNTIIKNMSLAGLFAQGSTVLANNSVFSNCGLYAVILSIGGAYDFRHCTIGNYWSESSRTSPSLVLNNYYKDVYGTWQVRELYDAYFGNCLIYGNIEKELMLDSYYEDLKYFKYKFENCLIRTELPTNNTNYYTDCIINLDPLFNNTTVPKNDLSINENSPARDKGKTSVSALIPLDILGNSRISDVGPDIGAYEYIPSGK
jgi:hypothetical protein